MAQWTADRLKPYGDSIFATLGRLARERNCVNLGQGFPDYDGPDRVKEAAVKALREGHNQYSPLPGVPVLAQAIADKTERETGIAFNPATEITVLNGSTESMYAAINGICNPGDQFILFEPIYDTYVPTIQMAGGEVVAVPLEAPDFKFDPDRLRAAFSKKTKAIIVNTPHNPTGRVFTREEMQLIADLCIEFDCYAITDEVYEYLTFDKHEHLSLVTFDGMRDRTITISSTAKSLSLTGWKVGWTIAPPEATIAIRRMHQFIAFAIATPLQWGIAEGLNNASEILPGLKEDMVRKRNFLADALNSVGFKALKPEGTFFMLADFSEISDKKDIDFATWMLTSDVRVAAIPISVFYMHEDAAPRNFVRFCFAKKQETLDAGIENLKTLRSYV